MGAARLTCAHARFPGSKARKSEPRPCRGAAQDVIENELTGDAVERPLLLTDGDGDGRKPDEDYVSDCGAESD